MPHDPLASQINQGKKRVGAIYEMGTVVAVGVSDITVNIRGNELIMKSSYAATVDDSVLVLRYKSRAKAIGATATPTDPIIPVAPPGPLAAGDTLFPAVQSATYRSGWRTDTTAVFQGSTGLGANNGAWFYGTAPQNALTGAVVTRVQIWLHRMVGSGAAGAQTVHVHRHTSATRPVSADVTRNAGPVNHSLEPGQAGWYDLTTSWGTALVAGTSRGFGLTADPYLRLASLDDDPQSGALRFSWTRF